MGSYTFSDSEIWYIASQNAPCIVVGVPDPTIGFTAKEISKLGKDAYLRLVDKALIINSGDTDVFADDLVIISKALAHPEHIVVFVSESVPDPKKTQYFYYSHGLIVELELIEKTQYYLTIHTEKDVILQRTERYLKDNIFVLNNDQSFNITDAKFQELINCVNSGKLDQAQKLCSPQDADSLAFIRAIRSPIFNFAVTIHKHCNNPQLQHINGIGVFAGDNSLWQLRVSKNGARNPIQIKPVATLHLQALLKEILP